MPVLRAISYGPEVSAVAAEGGTVAAVVGRGLYLQEESGAIVGVVDTAAPDGPLSLRVEGLDSVLPGLGICVGDPFRGDARALDIDGRLRIDLRPAQPWMPPEVRLEAGRDALDGALGALRLVVARQGSRLGLGPFVRGEGGESGPFLSLAGGRLKSLAEAVRAGDEGRAVESAIGLLGLGPGLTPSCDDLLAGLLACGAWAAQTKGLGTELFSVLAGAVRREAPSRTTRLSVRLLDHAARGLLYEPAMHLGAALFGGRVEEIESAALCLFAIGHSSGTDMAVGFLFYREISEVAGRPGTLVCRVGALA